MNLDLARTFYQNILLQVLNLEREKKKVAEALLLVKGEQEKIPYVRDLLRLDLAKHRLMEQALSVAAQNKSDEVMEHILKMYPEAACDNISCIIRGSIERDESLLKPLEKAIKHPDFITFFERRILREIEKFAMEEARVYNRADL